MGIPVILLNAWLNAFLTSISTQDSDMKKYFTVLFSVSLYKQYRLFI